MSENNKKTAVVYMKGTAEEMEHLKKDILEHVKYENIAVRSIFSENAFGDELNKALEYYRKNQIRFFMFAVKQNSSSSKKLEFVQYALRGIVGGTGKQLLALKRFGSGKYLFDIFCDINSREYKRMTSLAEKRKKISK